MFLIYILILSICFFITTLQLNYNVLDLHEGSICKKVDGVRLDHVCMRKEQCMSLAEFIRNRTYLDICSFGENNEPIFCCPPTISTHSDLYNRKTNVLQEVCKRPKLNFTFGGLSVLPGEIKHMTLIGYGEMKNDVQWVCVGSLISERWILTAAHCREIALYGLAKWARLGVINIMNAKGPHDYEIIQHVVHPNYKPPSMYHDIALFRSDKIISDDGLYVLPVCLNWNSSFTPPVLTAVGWGRPATDIAISTGQEVLKAELEVVPAKTCNNKYFSRTDERFKSGIMNDRMICARPVDSSRDTCIGDSGSPLETKLKSMGDYRHVLLGIASFGKSCDDPDAPRIYTRVSYYYSWIDSIVRD